MLENIAFIELKRRGKSIFYHYGERECDFIIQDGSKIVQAIQVCQTMKSSSTRERELAGLMDALVVHSLKEGFILTESEEAEEVLTHEGRSYKIHIIPLWKWLLDTTSA